MLLQKEERRDGLARRTERGASNNKLAVYEGFRQMIEMMDK